MEKIKRNGFLLTFVLTVFVSCSTSKFFYTPVKELKNYPDTTFCHFEEINFKSSDGNNLNGWFLKPKNKPIIGTILHFHGSGRNISYEYLFSDSLLKTGFQIMVFDYQGYGKSEGKASQETVLEDGIAALYYIKQREDVKNTKLILFGQSLGGHLACVVAAQSPDLIDALAIEGAFTGYEQIAVSVSHKHGAPKFLTRIFVQSKYNAIDEIGKIPDIPKLIIHSSEDALCPFFMGKELYEKASFPKEFWEVKGKHIRASQIYKGEFVKRFINLINQVAI